MARARTIALLVCALAFATGGAHAGDACTFDQDAVREHLHALAARHRAGLVGVDEPASTVRWREANGRTITVGFGGCVHLGVSVEVNAPPGEPDARVGVEHALEAAARYWSAQDAEALRQVLQADPSALATLERDGEVELQATDAFPLGARAWIERGRAGVGWTLD